jgi:L-seryl-tRNA(Ser) seleniumtransferase
MTDPRSAIPSVDGLLASADFASLIERYPRARVVAAARAAVDAVRARIARGESVPDVAATAGYARGAAEGLAAGDVPSLRRVINATGVVLHTNLGRAPLAKAAVEAMLAAAGEYSNLEFDLEAGERGSRYVHCVSLLTELTGAEDALVVNNAAAALVLALNTLGRGRGVIVSRGELVEIGGGFRIPEILERSGAGLLEVGATNRTRVRDYEVALDGGDVAAVLKVHRSNFRITGFTEEASLQELAELARARGVPLVHDLGSGLMVEPERLGLGGEPRPQESLAAGAALVAFSGDKLLGGPQAGLVLGRRDIVASMRANPLCRALRVDKGTLAALEATLRLYREPTRAIAEIPTLRMLAADVSGLEERAIQVAGALTREGIAGRVVETSSPVGGGTFPGMELASRSVALLDVDASALARALRMGQPAVVARIADGALLLDMRTVLPGQEHEVVDGVIAARRRVGI